MKNKKSYLIILIIVITLFSNNLIFAEEEVKVILDGDILEFDVNPIILDGTTYVPMRKIFEALHGKVEWLAEERRVTCLKDNVFIEMKIDSEEVHINGKPILLSNPIFIETGRTMVPLRLISESLGAEVDWLGDKREIIIESEKIPQIDVKTFSVKNGQRELDLGMKEKDLINIMGKPDRIEKHSSGMKYYIYNSENIYEYINFIRLGLYKNKLVECETNSPNWIFDYEYSTFGKLPYRPNKIKDDYLKKDIDFTLLYDRNRSGVSFINVGLLEDMKGYEFTYEDRKISEDLLFDYINVYRVKEGVKPLIHNRELKKLAGKHSEEMIEKNYFSHNDGDGNSPKVRLKELPEFIAFGENISKTDTLDPKEILNLLCLEREDRDLIINPNFEEVGITIKKSKSYYTTVDYGSFY